MRVRSLTVPYLRTVTGGRYHVVPNLSHMWLSLAKAKRLRFGTGWAWVWHHPIKRFFLLKVVGHSFSELGGGGGVPRESRRRQVCKIRHGAPRQGEGRGRRAAERAEDLDVRHDTGPQHARARDVVLDPVEPTTHRSLRDQNGFKKALNFFAARADLWSGA